MTMVIGLCTCFPLLLVLMFGMSDLTAVNNSALPSIEIVYQVYVSANRSIIIIILTEKQYR